jgi:hypothetical protein
MVNIQPTTTTVNYTDSKPWLVAVDRTFNKSGTLDLSKITNAAHKTADGLYVLSGIPLKETTPGSATTLLEPANLTTDVIVGFLFEYHTFAATGKTSCSVLTHGAVSKANIPGGAPATVQITALPLIRFDA